jgi:energy-coupling factor transporter ATP-binding protein EcfA2
VLELVDTLEETCEDLSESVNLAIQNPQKFGLTKSIVDERVNYIKKVRLGLEEVKNTVTDRELIEKAINSRNLDVN